ncbi:MAG: hypothetical protein Q4B88_05025 [Moraxella sp.]|nr:hypothetical protein [Moraxella sp.]
MIFCASVLMERSGRVGYLTPNVVADFTSSIRTPIGNNDLWIASHALAVGAVVVTHNNKEFERIGELRVEDWTV